ncbi:MAG: hypothetical protein GY696_27435, partial [Gammaproteobacteria bacterium]|nr:hypothetical protein [Gammaproteobacteria bacterium]
WIKRIKDGRDSLEDEYRSGRPATSTSESLCDNVRAILDENRRSTIDAVAEELGISHGSAHSVVHDKLGMRWFCARWVPRLLEPEQKLERVRQCSVLRFLLEDYGEDFWNRIVTTDETWLPYYNPETKAQSMSWVKPGEGPPVKAKVVPSVGKVMITVFWDCEGVILISSKGRDHQYRLLHRPIGSLARGT